ncbi:MAG: hypothetical protein J6B13_07690 [Muribaculaceae bacterium]|nr:hypothetical protein [Muribaculaceae bacterium]
MRARSAAILLIALTATAIALVVGRRAFAPREASVEVDHTVFPVRGIDISAHNGNVDFGRVLRDSIDFVYIKATEGATWRDAMFERNYRAARDAGLAVGIYHFFRFDVPGWRQSVNIIGLIGDRHLDLPVAIDVEEWGNPSEFTTDEIIADLRSLVELLRQNGREPIIYTNKNGYYRFVRGHFDDVALWICSFTSPALAERGRWTIWQHSHVGRVDGISGDVDLCTFNSPGHGDYAEWLRANPAIARPIR